MVLKVSGLGKTFPDGTRVFEDLSFEVRRGEFLVVLGPNGTGKTTLLRILNGLLEPSAGEVLVEGQRVSPENLREIRKKVGMVFQHFNLVGNLSALNNVLTGMLDMANTLPSLFYLFRKEHKLRAMECLDQVGLLEKAYSRVDTLSGGQQQRVGISRAIVKEPVLLLADEPIASLDPLVAFNVMSLLKDININYGVTIICNLHQVELGLRFADRIIGLANGRIIIDKPVEDVDAQYIQSIYGKHDTGMFFGPRLSRSHLDEEIKFSY
jgi:phosphonate transport system ATP-binding protein